MRHIRAALLALLLLAAACGSAGPAGSASPPASAGPSAASSPSASPVPTPIAVRAGAPAYVDVSVATEWRSPGATRPVDAPALANPVGIRAWLSSLSATDQAGLIDRADSQVLLGDRVNVIAITGGWAQVVVPDQPTPLDARGYPGWIPLAQLNAVAPVAAESFATVIKPTAWLLRGGIPELEVSFGTRLPVVAIAGSIARLGLPGGKTLDAPLASVSITAAVAAALPGTAAAVVASLSQFLGLRYLWAGTSGFGFDCSGLVYNVFKAHGVTLPRDAQDQAGFGIAIGRQALAPGDLVFLASGGVVHHVAVYLGAGMLLDSPDLGKGVEQVSIAAQPYASEYSGARRVLP